jgi:hypothetical protein
VYRCQKNLMHRLLVWGAHIQYNEGSSFYG